MSALRSRLQQALPSARSWRQQTRSLSNLRLAKGSISSLYQAKGRTEESLNEIGARLATKKFELDVPLMLKMEAERKEAQALASNLQAERNSKSKQIGMMKGKGEDTTAIMAEVDGLKAKTTEAEEKMKAIEAKLEDYLLQIPNAPVSWPVTHTVRRLRFGRATCILATQQLRSELMQPVPSSRGFAVDRKV